MSSSGTSRSSTATGTARTFSQAFPESSGSIEVSPSQRGNPLLKFVKASHKFVPNQIADFVMGQTCALYLSLKFHLLNPDYLHSKMSELKHGYRLKLLLLVIDIPNSEEPLTLLTSLASANDFTLIVSWSNEECAIYLETYKAFEKKSAETIQEKIEPGYMSKLEDTLTTIRSINRTDAKVLSRSFGSLHNIMQATKEDLALCQGIGNKKVSRLHDTFNMPFR